MHATRSRSRLLNTTRHRSSSLVIALAIAGGVIVLVYVMAFNAEMINAVADLIRALAMLIGVVTVALGRKLGQGMTRRPRDRENR